MGPLRAALLLFALTGLSACGLTAPEIQESGGSVKGQLLVQAITHAVHCELRQAVYDTYKDGAFTDKGKPANRADFMNNWGVEMTLSLTVDEKTSVNPNVTWAPNLFSLALGYTETADATRVDKQNFYYTIQEIKDVGPCSGTPIPSAGEAIESGTSTSLLIKSELGLSELMHEHVMLVGTLEIKAAGASDPTAQNVISHDIKFDILNSGSVDPVAKFSRVWSLNPTGTFFSTSRERTHELTFTLGPTAPGNKTALIPQAENLHLANLLQGSFSSALRNASSP